MSALSADARDVESRKAAMALLALAPLTDLETAFAALPSEPDVKIVRAPEIGLVMVRGRMGGGGRAFNLGEATVTRCTVRLPSGSVGVAHILGRSKRQALLAAIFDAIWQDDAAWVERTLLAPLRASLAAADTLVREETAATRVDFFTLVRGDD
jgi:alpha-D-ribose 1-methylphosphonate 5-triphosphate synthase subunit PhnG